MHSNYEGDKGRCLLMESPRLSMSPKREIDITIPVVHHEQGATSGCMVKGPHVKSDSSLRQWNIVNNTIQYALPDEGNNRICLDVGTGSIGTRVKGRACVAKADSQHLNYNPVTSQIVHKSSGNCIQIQDQKIYLKTCLSAKAMRNEKSPPPPPHRHTRRRRGYLNRLPSWGKEMLSQA